VLINEKSTWTGDHASDYAESKYLAELEIFRGAEEGLTVSMVNPTVILSGSKTSGSSASLFDYVWREKSFYPEGSVNYVDARDVADAVFQLYQNPIQGEKFILSAGSISLEDFFSQIARLMKKRRPSIKVSPGLAYWAGWTEEMLSIFFNREPLVTRLSARLARQSIQYDSQKVKDQLGIQFRSLEETLIWCCNDFVRNVKANK
jgi:nucleoside-diphosphate-sugar epimerase